LLFKLHIYIHKKFWEELIAYFPWYDTGHIENDASNNSSIVACICYRGKVSTEPLPSNDWGIFIELLPSKDRGIFIEPLHSNGKGTFTEPLPINDRGYTQTHTHRQQRDLISLLYFFQNKESRLKSLPLLSLCRLMLVNSQGW
jgi:hypothetical protein